MKEPHKRLAETNKQLTNAIRLLIENLQFKGVLSQTLLPVIPLAGEKSIDSTCTLTRPKISLQFN